MAENEAQRRQRLAERVDRIMADDRYPPALKQYLIDEESRIAERDIEAMKADEIIQ